MYTIVEETKLMVKNPVGETDQAVLTGMVIAKQDSLENYLSKLRLISRLVP